MNGERRAGGAGRIYVAASLSLVYLLAIHFISGPPPSTRREMAEASRLMERAVEAVGRCREARGIPIDAAADPNRTGLVGLEASSITTSMGRLEAKRTSTNPEFAALLALLLRQAGVKKGEAVAIGASSSFPAFIIASVAASRAVGAEPLLIVSLGASEWGANIPGFNWTDMEDCLRASGVLEAGPIALALGGDEDAGLDMDPAGREFLVSLIRGRGAPFIEEAGLEANVARRLGIYEQSRGNRAIAAFINIGGSWANMGTHAEVLKLRPGLTPDVFIPPPADRGVLQAMAARKVPVIHLLNVRGLAERYGLPWDPRPLPDGLSGDLSVRAAGRVARATVLTAGFVLFVFLIVAFRMPWRLP
ncbi:MAG: poly-gamma-glutamate system protein [Candidatus Aminicenantes bacterium]